MRSLRGSDTGAGNPAVLLLLGALAAGGLVGGVLGAVGGLDLVGEPAHLATAATASYYDCPDGRAAGSVTRGDRVFITGRDESGGWVEIRSPASVQSRVWMRVDHVLADSEPVDLPVHSCLLVVEVIAESTTTIVPVTVPTSTTTTATTTTSTTTTTTTTVAADTTPPSISTPGVTPNPIWEQDYPGIACPPNTPRQATVSTTVTDSGGVASVTASWVVPGLGTVTKTMSGGGSARTVLFGPYPAQTWPENSPSYQIVVTITIRATDSFSNVATRTTTITVTNIAQCFQ